MTGYGKNAGLPYDEYLAAGIDFAPIWWDPETSGPSPGTGSEGQGIAWYVDEATRYKSGDWPKQQFAWFDEKDAVYEFQTRQTPTPVYVGDCADCPAGGGPGQPGTPEPTGFVARAGGPDA